MVAGPALYRRSHTLVNWPRKPKVCSSTDLLVAAAVEVVSWLPNPQVAQQAKRMVSPEQALGLLWIAASQVDFEKRSLSHGTVVVGGCVGPAVVGAKTKNGSGVRFDRF